MWRMSNLYGVVTVMTFCSLNNYALPPLISAVESKADLKSIIFVVGLISFTIYSGFGLILGIYFGDNVETPVSTLWRTSLVSVMLAGRPLVCTDHSRLHRHFPFTGRHVGLRHGSGCCV